MNPELPPALYGYLLGATLSGGLVLYIVYRLLRKAPLLERVKALARAEEATTIVEFPFALIILVMFTVFAWQLAFMASAHLVVDYAAYVAARSASVVIPQDATADGDPANSPVETKDPDTTESGWGDGVNMETQDPDGEAPNAIDARDSVPAGGLLSRVQDATPEELQGVSPLDISYSGKVSVVHGAAVMACYPISGLLSLNNIDPASLIAFQGVTKVPGGEWIMDKLGGLIGSGNQSGKDGPGRPVFLDFANRYMYAYMNTKVRLQPQENAGNQPRSFGGGEPLTAEVIHDFQLDR